MLDFILSPAYAQAAGAQPSLMLQVMNSPAPLVILVVLFYFMLIRPQMRRSKEQKTMIDKLAKGDEVVTGGGLAGRITGIGEVFLTLEIADKVEIKVQRQSVTTVLQKGTLKSL